MYELEISRRGAFRIGAGAVMSAALAGCATMDAGERTVAARHDPATIARYGAMPDERFPLPATDISRVEPVYLRQQVDYYGPETPGTLVVDTRSRLLFLVRENGQALRYGIGVGKEGLEFEGTARIARKAEWPRWTPTPDMVAREPERYGPVAGGVPPGLDNPLGPRALYLYQGDRDTLFRIHGTTEPWSIGRAVSSGCIRLINQDIIDLYGRVPRNSVVVVKQDEPAIATAPEGYGGGSYGGAPEPVYYEEGV